MGRRWTEPWGGCGGWWGKGDQLGKETEIQRVLESQRPRDTEKEENKKQEQERKVDSARDPGGVRGVVRGSGETGRGGQRQRRAHRRWADRHTDRKIQKGSEAEKR